MRERFMKSIHILLTTVAVLALVVVSTPQLAIADTGVVVDLALLPDSQTVDVDDIFDITIQAQCDEQIVSVIAAFVDFDPAYLEVLSVTPGTSLPTVVQNTYDNTAGTIDYQAGKLGGPFPSGTFTVATISFKALDLTASTAVTFHSSGIRTTDVVSGEAGAPSVLDELFGATVTIGVINTPPVLSNGQVNPDPGYVTTDFTYSVTYTDDDNDAPMSITVTIDGSPQDMTEVDPGDTDYTDGKDYEYTTGGLDKGSHTFQFAASDGVDDATGDTGSHDGPTVQNSPPTAPVVDVTPDSPVTTDDLVCTITTPSTDPDAGDTIIYSYAWYKDDVLQAALTTNTVDSSNTAKDEVWKCVVTPNDGTEDGATDEDEVTIQNTPPVLSDGAVIPPSGDVTTDFTYSVTYTDADNDPPASPTVSIDGGGPIDMTEVNPADTVYTDGKDYEYTTGGLDKGSHTFQFAASDGFDNATGDTGVHTGPGVDNTAPVLSAGQVNPDPGYVTTDFTYSVTYADDDNDAPMSITVTIDSGAPQDMTEVNPGDTDYTDGKDYEYTTSGLDKGSHTFQFAASDGVDDAIGDTGVHDGPTVQNSPPTAPVVDVTPDSPVTADDLVCTITTPSTDPDDGDTITYTYEWYKDDVLQGALTTDTVDSTNTAKDEVWKCVVTPNDGTADGPTDEDQVTIGNSPPTAPVVDVTPDSPVTADDLVCTITTPSTDPDAGDTVTYLYEWYKDDVLQAGLTTNTVASSNTAKGQVWKCVVTPNDGTADGPTDEDQVTVENSLPTAPVVDVTPDSPVTTDDLVCTIATPSTDPDAGDTVTYTYEWYKDDVLQAGLTTDTVDSINTAKGEVWKCVVTPNDGTAGGPTDEDEAIILNSPPVANAGADQMALIGTNITLDGSGSSDADGDPLDYSWTQTGGANVTLSNPTAVNATFTPTEAGNYTFSLVVYDGIDYSPADTVTIRIKASNTAPVLSDGAVSPNSGSTSVTFTYSVVYTDDDNDAPMSITVTIDGGGPQDMNVRSGQDGNYTNSEIYEYAVTGATLDTGSHTFQFAASDGIADATGDIDIHNGPTVSSGGGGDGGGGGGGGLDTRAPVISNIESCDCTKTSITIKWKTGESGTSRVEYWASEHIFSPLDESLVRYHVVKLTNLKPCCEYHFRVISEDSAGNVAISEEKNFTTMGTPATFTIGALSISPAEVQVGESITISILVTNNGDVAGTYEAILEIDNTMVATESVTLAGGASEEVTFTTSRDVAGTYTVSIGDQSGTIVVTAFTISALDISPTQVNSGGDVNISALITNTGNVTGAYEAILKIDNVVVATKSVTLAGGASEEVTFTTSTDVAGTYAVDLNGLTGTFVVKTGPNWWLIGGVIAAVIVAVLLVLYFRVWRKRGV